MSNRPADAVRGLARLYELALRLYPDGFRHEFGAEMQGVFRLKAGDAAQLYPLYALLFSMPGAPDQRPCGAAITPNCTSARSNLPFCAACRRSRCWWR